MQRTVVYTGIDAVRAHVRMDVGAREAIVRTLLDTFAERGLTYLDIEKALLDAFGTFANVISWGRELGTVQFAWNEIGVPDESERATNLSPPKYNPMPESGMNEIKAAFERARAATRAHGIWVTEYQMFWIPVTEWPEWKEKIQAVSEDVETIKREHFLNNYKSVKRSSIARAKAMALEAYAALKKQGVKPEGGRNKFRDAVISRVSGAFPGRDEIGTGIGFSWKTLSPSTQDIIDVVVAVRDQVQHGDMEGLPTDKRANIFAAREAERIIRTAMLAERAEIWRLQAERSGLLSDLMRNAGGALFALASGIGSGDWLLTPSNSRKLNAALRHWLRVGGLMLSSAKVDTLVEQALQFQSVPSRRRDKNALRQVLRSLARELKTLAKQKPSPYARAGQGLVSLDVVDGV